MRPSDFSLPSDQRSPRVTLIDPFAGGHHIPYAVLLCQQLTGQGLDVNLIGPTKLVEEVSRQTPLSRSAVLELYQGDEADYYRRGKWHEERSSYLFVRSTLHLARQWNSDIAHFVFLDSFILSLLAARPWSGRMRVYATLHWAYMLPRFRRPGRSGRLRAAAQLLGLRGLLRSRVQLQVHTPSFATDLAALTGRAQIHYLPHPAEEPFLSPVSAVTALRRQLGVTPDIQLLLAFGGTRRNKGADVAIMALPSLPERVHLMVVWATEAFTEQDLSDLATRLRVRHRVHLHLKFVSPKARDLYFATAAAAVLPYNGDFAGQSGFMFQAGAVDTPVVASDAGSTAEFVRHFGLGQVFNYAGTLQEQAHRLAQSVTLTFRHPPDPETRAERRRHFLQAHSVEHFTERLLQTYQLGNPGPSGDRAAPPTSSIRPA